MKTVKPNITIKNVDHHRNGISGAPFFVVTFRDLDEERNMVATVFPRYEEWSVGDANGGYKHRYLGEGTIAVLDVDLLAKGDIEFGSNSWRGDCYEGQIIEAINNHTGGVNKKIA